MDFELGFGIVCFPRKAHLSANEMSHFPFHGHPCIAKYGNPILRHSSCRRKIGGFHFSPFFVCVDCVVESRCPPFVSCKRLHRQSSSTQCCCTYMQQSRRRKKRVSYNVITRANPFLSDCGHNQPPLRGLKGGSSPPSLQLSNKC